MDMGSLLVIGTLLNYKRDAYVHCWGSLSKANIDSNSHDEGEFHSFFPTNNPQVEIISKKNP